MVDMSKTKDILLAEDDNDDVLIFELAVKNLKFPYLLRQAQNGDVLFVLLKDRIPYILFLDIHMPCKDGMACITEIRKNRAYDKMPVIMYTAEFSEKMIEECYRSGANLYVTKTDKLSVLTEKLRKVFAVDWDNYVPYPAQNQFILS